MEAQIKVYHALWVVDPEDPKCTPYIILVVDKEYKELSFAGGSVNSRRGFTSGKPTPAEQAVDDERHLEANCNREVREELQGVPKGRSDSPSWKPSRADPAAVYRTRSSTERGPFYVYGYELNGKACSCKAMYLYTNVSDTALPYAEALCRKAGLARPTFQDKLDALAADIEEKNQELGDEAEMSGAVILSLPALMHLSESSATGAGELWSEQRSYINEVSHFREYFERMGQELRKERSRLRPRTPPTPTRGNPGLQAGNAFALLSED